MKSIDISMPLFEGMPAFPGDPLFGTERTHSIDRGNPYNLSALKLSSHAGTHIDPPLHFIPSGLPIDQIDLTILSGPCRVVQVPSEATNVGRRELREAPPETERLLLRTANSQRWSQRLEFFSEYVALSPEGAEALIEGGTRLVGIDSPSIERDASGTFPVHHRLLGSGVLILEGLMLSDVPAGTYDLQCLPLRLRDGDGGPARAVLRAP